MIYQSNVHLENLSDDGLNSFEIINNEFRSDDIVNWCINHVPRPPVCYRFSKRQQYEQYHFFKAKLDCASLSRQLDIYQATIVLACNLFIYFTFAHLHQSSFFFIVPDRCSSDLLHFVQALLVTHAESKLNTTVPQLPSPFHRSVHWCENLH